MTTKKVTEADIAEAAARVKRAPKARVSEADIVAALPEAARQAPMPPRLAESLREVGRRPGARYKGERKELVAWLLDEIASRSFDLEDGPTIELAKLAIRLGDLRILRACAAHLVRERAFWIALGEIQGDVVRPGPPNDLPPSSEGD